MLLLEVLSSFERQQDLDFAVETRMICSGARSNTHSKDEELHILLELEAAHWKPFGHASESEAREELSKDVDKRSTGKQREDMREISDQCSLLSAIEITKSNDQCY